MVPEPTSRTFDGGKIQPRLAKFDFQKSRRRDNCVRANRYSNVRNKANRVYRSL
jgi:hypothetical protein